LPPAALPFPERRHAGTTSEPEPSDTALSDTTIEESCISYIRAAAILRRKKPPYRPRQNNISVRQPWNPEFDETVAAV
jgi:hypothetical protein